MPGTLLTNDEWAAELRNGWDHTAFRLELQPVYSGADDDILFQAWLKGDRTPPIYDDASVDWLSWADG